MARAKDLVGVRVTSKLRGLRPLLESWTEVVLDYCKVDSYVDNPWWYNERASLSTLAGAAWRLPGWSALEEFATTKRGFAIDEAGSKKASRKGRCDLYVSHRSTGFAFEAKQAWRSMGKRREPHDLRAILASAKKDAGNLRSNQAEHRLGAVFVAPYIPQSEVSTKVGRNQRVDTNLVSESFQSWLVEQQSLDLDACAYVAVGRCEEFVGPGKRPRLFPGVLLAITRCATGTRRVRSTRV